MNRATFERLFYNSLPGWLSVCCNLVCQLICQWALWKIFEAWNRVRVGRSSDAEVIRLISVNWIDPKPKRPRRSSAFPISPYITSIDRRMDRQTDESIVESDGYGGIEGHVYMKETYLRAVARLRLMSVMWNQSSVGTSESTRFNVVKIRSKLVLSYECKIVSMH